MSPWFSVTLEHISVLFVIQIQDHVRIRSHSIIPRELSLTDCKTRINKLITKKDLIGLHMLTALCEKVKKYYASKYGRLFRQN